MSSGFWLTAAQFKRLEPFLPTGTRGVARVDDRRVISGIVQVPKSGSGFRSPDPGSEVRLPLEGRRAGLRPAQDALQSVRALARQGRLGERLRRPGCRGRPAGGRACSTARM